MFVLYRHMNRYGMIHVIIVIYIDSKCCTMRTPSQLMINIQVSMFHKYYSELLGVTRNTVDLKICKQHHVYMNLFK